MGFRRRNKNQPGVPGGLDSKVSASLPSGSPLGDFAPRGTRHRPQPAPQATGPAPPPERSLGQVNSADTPLVTPTNISAPVPVGKASSGLFGLRLVISVVALTAVIAAFITWNKPEDLIPAASADADMLHARLTEMAASGTLHPLSISISGNSYVIGDDTFASDARPSSVRTWSNAAGEWCAELWRGDQKIYAVADTGEQSPYYSCHSISEVARRADLPEPAVHIPFKEIAVGDCLLSNHRYEFNRYSVFPEYESGDAVGVPCDYPYDTAIVALERMPELEHYSDPFFDHAYDTCDSLVDYSPDIFMSFQVPNSRQWEAGDRRLICEAVVLPEYQMQGDWPEVAIIPTTLSARDNY